MGRKWKAGLITLACVVMVGCAAKPPKEIGTVIEKHHTPAHWLGHRAWNEDGVGYWEPHDSLVADAWALRLEICSKGLCKRIWREVDKATYDGHNVGDTYEGSAYGYQGRPDREDPGDVP